MALATGTRLSSYEVIGMLGAGGMGEVYRARDLTLGREVAIKILPETRSADPEQLARFDREARVLAALNHPHIGGIYGVVEAEGTRGLVLELVEGPTLGDLVVRWAADVRSGKPRDWNSVRHIAVRIVDALDAAHERGIIHRDLKPANVKVRPDGAVKVLDFGLAKLTTDDQATAETDETVSQHPTQAGVVLGTVSYMSPEQARGRPVDMRTDVWAFGCVLFEMVTGKVAFAGDTHSDIIARILEREPDWTVLPADTPPGIRRVLARCLRKDVRERLRHIADARDDLIEDEPVRSTGDTRSSRRPNSRLPWLVASALGVGLMIALLPRSSTPDAASAVGAPILSRATRVTNSPASEFGPVASPDNKWVAYYSNERGPTDVWVKFLDSGTTLNLTESRDLALPVRTGLGGLAVSPDGTRLAFYARRTASPDLIYDTWVIPMPAGGAPQRMLQGIQGLQWSPDGSRIAAIMPGSARGDALILAAGDGSNPTVLVPAAAGHHVHWPVWSRDGSHIYFIYSLQPWNTEPAEIYRVSAAGGTPEPVVQTPRRAIYPVPFGPEGLIYAANPDRADLGLWWQAAPGAPGRLLTTGLGEPTEARLSTDGTKLVVTLLEMRQSLVSLPVLAGNASSSLLRPITTGYTGDIDPDINRAGDRIVFSSSRSGDRNLWTANSDGSDPRPLTSGRAIDERPAFAPDGSQVAFVSDRGGARSIWLISADGGVPRRLAVVDVLDDLTWSPDGTQIGFARPGNDLPVLAAVSVADGRVSSLSTPAAAHVPAWSPTEDLLAYLEPSVVESAQPLAPLGARSTLRFVNAAGQRLFSTLPEHAVGSGYLAWAPDGRRVAQLSVPANSPAGVWVIEPTSKTPYRKVLDLPAGVRPRGIAWTADGTRLVLGSEQPVSDIILYDVAR